MRWSIRFGVSTLLAAFGAVGCRRTTPVGLDAAVRRPVLGEVSVRDLTESPRPAKLDVAALRDGLRAQILASGLLAEGGDAGAASPAVRFRFEVALDGAEVKGKGVARAAVRLRIDTRPSEATGAMEDDVQGGGEHPYDVGASTDRDAVFSGLAKRTTTDLLRDVLDRARLPTAPAASLHALAVADGGANRVEGIRQIGRRNLHGEAPMLIRLLENGDEAIRDAAIGALVEMKEPSAVPAMTRSRAFGDTRELRKILDAVATIGGKEAEQYLDFVARNHEDEEIRRIATEARARLARHAKDR